MDHNWRRWCLSNVAIMWSPLCVYSLNYIPCIPTSQVMLKGDLPWESYQGDGSRLSAHLLWKIAMHEDFWVPITRLVQQQMSYRCNPIPQNVPRWMQWLIIGMKSGRERPFQNTGGENITDPECSGYACCAGPLSSRKLVTCKRVLASRGYLAPERDSAAGLREEPAGKIL